jgi:hypothetical protein
VDVIMLEVEVVVEAVVDVEVVEVSVVDVIDLLDVEMTVTEGITFTQSIIFRIYQIRPVLWCVCSFVYTHF